ncbi:MAG TPA: M15 family metallopeptidase [Xanthobacteraceae bacterium]|jgi:D-alanyl-D-alanine dipeptidase
MKAFFQALETLRQKPIPDLAPLQARKQNYRAYPIDRMSALYGEKLVEIRDLGVEGENYYFKTDNPPYYEAAPGAIEKLFLRESVASRLRNLDQRLREIGLRVHVYDAIRPRAVQAYFHDVWMPRRVRERHPNFSEQEMLAEVEKYWAAPTTSEDSPAPHSTGGAVDLTICKIRNGEPLYMGSIFDDATELAHTDYFERAEQDALGRFSDAEARQNRRLLYWLMTGEGFASNPNEWWHFSWGDQMWAKLTGAKAAVFGPARDA